jgi:hypothetical protein
MNWGEFCPAPCGSSDYLLDTLSRVPRAGNAARRTELVDMQWMEPPTADMEPAKIKLYCGTCERQRAVTRLGRADWNRSIRTARLGRIEQGELFLRGGFGRVDEDALIETVGREGSTRTARTIWWAGK